MYSMIYAQLLLRNMFREKVEGVKVGHLHCSELCETGILAVLLKHFIGLNYDCLGFEFKSFGAYENRWQMVMKIFEITLSLYEFEL